MAYKQKNSVKSLCSGSPITNLKSGGKMISSDKGSSNYMKEDPGSAILQGGRKRVGGRVGGSVGSASAGTNPPKSSSAIGQGNTFYSDQVELMSDPTKTNIQTYNRDGDVVDQKTGLKDVDATNRAKAGIVDEMRITQSSTDQPTALDIQNQKRKAKATNPPTPKKRKPVEGIKSTIKPTGVETKDLRKVHDKEGKKIDRGASAGKDKGTTVKTSKITSKKSPPPSAKITRAQIKDNKDTNKESGMSKRQIRLEKTKLKAANARYETTSDKTKAIGGKEGQRKRAKTKRLEKRASRIEGRIKRKADKKANK